MAIGGQQLGGASNGRLVGSRTSTRGSQGCWSDPVTAAGHHPGRLLHHTLYLPLVLACRNFSWAPGRPVRAESQRGAAAAATKQQQNSNSNSSKRSTASSRASAGHDGSSRPGRPGSRSPVWRPPSALLLTIFLGATAALGSASSPVAGARSAPASTAKPLRGLPSRSQRCNGQHRGNSCGTEPTNPPHPRRDPDFPRTPSQDLLSLQARCSFFHSAETTPSMS